MPWSDFHFTEFTVAATGKMGFLRTIGGEQASEEVTSLLPITRRDWARSGAYGNSMLKSWMTECMVFALYWDFKISNIMEQR